MPIIAGRASAAYGAGFATSIPVEPFEPSGSFDFLATVTAPSAGLASVEFASIPTGYKHLQIRCFAKNTLSNTSTANFYIRFNGDSATNYNAHALYGNGTAATTNIPSGVNPVFAIWGLGGSSNFGIGIFDILDYANVNKFKTVKGLIGIENNGSGTVGIESGAWRNTNAITSISISMAAGEQTIAQHSQFALYGVK
jgi:hypothetical protein